MEKKRRMSLCLFDGGGQEGAGGSEGAGGGTGTHGSSGGGSFTYEQLDEIASSRASLAEKSAVKRFLQQKGLTEEEANTAFAEWQTQKEKNSPNSAQLTEERDAARKELASLRNANYLRDKGVSAYELDFVQFKVEKLVDDKTDFKKAADKFLKENPRYIGGGYRATTSSGAQGKGAGGGTNSSINDAIRNAIRR